MSSHTHNGVGLWDDNSETDSLPLFCQYGLIVLGPTTTTTKTTSTSTTTTTTATTATATPAANVSIEDCPDEDLNNWPYEWKVYGSKCFTLIGAPSMEWSNAKQHCEDVK